MDDLLGLEDLGQPVEPLVGNLDGPDVQLHAAVTAGLGVAARQGVEDGRLPRAGQPDDGDLHVLADLQMRAALVRPRSMLADGRGSVSRGQVHDVLERLAGAVAAQVVAEDVEGATRAPRRSTSDVCGVTMQLGSR